jgi:alkylhydroperoxidase/carboxymuconolactone decarboxylase family protein YurZ
MGKIDVVEEWLDRLPELRATYDLKEAFFEVWHTVAALSGMTGTRSQLQFHLGAAMNVGLTEAQMRDFVSVLAAKVGESESESAGEVLTAILNSRK